jgi:hypothetical protein
MPVLSVRQNLFSITRIHTAQAMVSLDAATASTGTIDVWL